MGDQNSTKGVNEQDKGSTHAKVSEKEDNNTPVDIPLTLESINHNMGQMASLLETILDKPNSSPSTIRNQKSSISSSEESESPGPKIKPKRKRRCRDKEDDDISLYASDDMEKLTEQIISTTKVTDQKERENDSPEITILKELANAFDEDDATV
jgi:hypothetical protein